MGGITTGVGLYSGIDTQSLIQQLLQIESRPKILAQQRIVSLQTQQAAYLEVNSTLSALEKAAEAFTKNNAFRVNKAVSSTPEVLTASAGADAAEGSYSFLVDRLVTTEQRLSRGFSDRDTAAVGASRFTFEVGGGGVTADMRLSELNGGNGVVRGEFSITDKAGASATIDLSKAVTVQDVLDAINSSDDVDVEARAAGDGIELLDNSGGAGTLRVQDVFNGETAASLGILGETAAGTTLASRTLSGSSVRYITGATPLALLNDGMGVHIVDGATDLRITARDGSVLNIDLGEVRREVLAEDFDGAEEGDPYVAPDPEPDGFEKPATRFETVQARATTVQAVIDRINAAADDAGVDIEAGIGGDALGLVLTDSTGGAGNLIIQNQSNRTTADDLGIATGETGVGLSLFEGARLLSGVQSVLTRSLNGGAGLTGSTLEFTDRAGFSTAINLDSEALAGSLSDVVDEVNASLAAAGVSITVGLNRAGNGLSLTDDSGGSGAVVVGGDLATQLGIETGGTLANDIDGANLQKRWVGLGTRLADLNGGLGIRTGEIRIIDSSGETATANITDDLKTVGDLLSFLNSRNVGIEASINSSGDGILITDTAGGAGDLVIEDETGTAARDLNILGSWSEEDGVTAADGTYEEVVEFLETDSLEDVARKINEAGVAVRAGVINDGGVNGFRLNLTSRNTGAAGRTLIDTGGLDLALRTIDKGQDAVVFYGSADPADAVLVTSSTNTLDGVIQGVSIDLNARSDEPVDLTVSKDMESIEQKMTELADAFNSVLDAIDKHTAYDQETNRRGSLLGDQTVENVRQRLYSAIQSRPQNTDTAFSFAFEVGLRIGDGARLEFDSARFRDAVAQDFEAVEDFVSAFRRAPSGDIELAPGITTPNLESSFAELGLAGVLGQAVEGLTDPIDGLVTRRTNTLDTQIDQQENRIDAFDQQLEIKRQRLEQQFLAMEQAIAQIQTQSQSLAGLQGFGG